MPFARALNGTLILAFLLPLLACVPALDWREVRVAQTPLRLLMPCRPHAQDRTIQLAGQTVQWRLLVCSTGDHSVGVAWADMGDPAQVGPALTGLLAAAGANLGAAIPSAAPLRVPGATPHAGSQQVLLAGRRSDGQPVQMQLALFTFGTLVFQVTALGPSVTTDLSEPLMDSLRFQP